MNFTNFNTSIVSQIPKVEKISVNNCLAYTQHIRNDYKVLAIILIIALILLLIKFYNKEKKP